MTSPYPRIFCLIFCLSLSACASPWKTNTIYRAETLKEVGLLDVASEIPSGGVVILAGQRDYEPFTENQKVFLNELTTVGNAPVSVGLVFLDRADQNSLDQYLAGNIAAEDFVRTTHWGSRKFELYERQILFPREYRGQTIALGAERAISAKIEQGGIAGLLAEEKLRLPPGFVLGAPPPEGPKRTYEMEAYEQDYAAYIVTEYLKFHPEQRLVILSDGFEPAYGGGLEPRLKARGVKSVSVIRQVDLSGRSVKDENEILRSAHRKPRYFWIERR